MLWILERRWSLFQSGLHSEKAACWWYVGVSFYQWIRRGWLIHTSGMYGWTDWWIDGWISKQGTKIPNQTTIQTRIYQQRDGTWTEDTLRLLLVCQGFNNEILIELKLKVCTSYHLHPLKILCYCEEAKQIKALIVHDMNYTYSQWIAMLIITLVTAVHYGMYHVSVNHFKSTSQQGLFRINYLAKTRTYSVCKCLHARNVEVAAAQ